MVSTDVQCFGGKFTDIVNKLCLSFSFSITHLVLTFIPACNENVWQHKVCRVICVINEIEVASKYYVASLV